MIWTAGTARWHRRTHQTRFDALRPGSTRFGKFVDLSILGLGFLSAIGAFLASGLPASAHAPHTCADNLPDSPVLSRHIEHADILSGSLSFDEVAAHGRALFIARFNRCDGQGRPETTGTGEARAAGAPDFMRMAEPEANSCAGCHHQPFAGARS